MNKWLTHWGGDDLDMWFDDPFFTGRNNMMSCPITNVYEKDGKIVMDFELPGVDENDIDVEITDKMVVVKGSTKQEKEEKGKKYYRMESKMNSFSRQIAWPELIKESTAKAELKDGVLQIMAEKADVRKITKLKVKKIDKMK